MNTSIDFVRCNLSIRKEHFEDCINIYNSIMLDKNLSIKSINNTMLEKISSKSFPSSNIKQFKSNRVEGLECMLHGINYITGKKFKGYDLSCITKYNYFFISLYILAGQVFSDGNHRVTIEFLQTQGFDYPKALQTINQIDLIRRKTSLDWDSIHNFIQVLINNIIAVKDEIDLTKQLDSIKLF
jgi:hypothetical protein